MGAFYDKKTKSKLIVNQAFSLFCNGTVIVPNVVGEPIREARQSLIEFAWEPITQTAEVVLSFVEEMCQSFRNCRKSLPIQRGCVEISHIHHNQIIYKK